MEQKKHQRQHQEQLPFSEQLRQSIINQLRDPAVLWGRAADSFPQNKRKQRLRSAGKITYSTIGNKHYYQIAEIKRCLRAHTIKSSDEMLGDLMQNGVYTPRKRRYENRQASPDHLRWADYFIVMRKIVV